MTILNVNLSASEALDLITIHDDIFIIQDKFNHIEDIYAKHFQKEERVPIEYGKLQSLLTQCESQIDYNKEEYAIRILCDEEFIVGFRVAALMPVDKKILVLRPNGFEDFNKTLEQLTIKSEKERLEAILQDNIRINKNKIKI